MNPESENKPALPLDELDLAPEWVKSPPKSYHHHEGEAPTRRSTAQEDGNRDRQQRRSRARSKRPSGVASKQARPAQDDRRDRSERHRSGRPPHRGRPREGQRPPQAQPPAPVPVQITFIAEEKGLASMISAIKQPPRAYAFFDLAKLILNKPERHLVKMTRKPEADGSQPSLFLVKPGENVFLTQEEALRFLFRQHAGLIFKEAKKPVEAPKGNFVFINRCGFTGELLGPPNYHEYQSRLVRHHQQRLAHVPFEQFKARIHTIKDPEVVKAWVEQKSFKREYECVLDEPPTVFASREEVEKHFLANHLDKLITSSAEIRISGQASRQLAHSGILEAVRQAWESERKFPFHTANGLRSRLRKEGFHFFKCKAVTFISVVRPKRFESVAGLTEQVQQLVTFLRGRRRCTRKELLETFPAAAAGPASPSQSSLAEPPPDGQTVSAAASAVPPTEEKRLLADLHWLIMEGYIVEFSNGHLWALEDKPPPVPASEIAHQATAAEPATEAVLAREAESNPQAAEASQASSAPGEGQADRSASSPSEPTTEP